MFKEHPKIPAPYCYLCPYKLEYPACDIRCASELESLVRGTDQNYAVSTVDRSGNLVFIYSNSIRGL